MKNKLFNNFITVIIFFSILVPGLLTQINCSKKAENRAGSIFIQFFDPN